MKAPKDKAAAEGAVGDDTYTIIGHLRNRKFFSFDELNKAIATELEKFNDRPFQKKGGSRRSVYEEEEKQFMKKLPDYPFELSSWKKAAVQLNYHIQIDRMNYFVPYEYAGKRVDVKASKDFVNIYYSGLQIASHRRLYGRRNQYSTIELHMPENHKLYEWNGDRFLMLAKNIGPNTYEVIDRHIHRYHVEEQSYKGLHIHPKALR